MTTNGWVFIIFVLFAMLFIQNLLNIFQYKGLMKQYKEIASRSYYQSAGNRKKWGRRRYALVGFTKEGIVNEVWILNGISLFAKFHQLHDFDGMSCEELLAALNMKNKDHQTIAEAANYMKLRLENNSSDEEYFKNNPRGLGVMKHDEEPVEENKEK